MTISVLQEISGNIATASSTSASNTFASACTPGSSIEVYVISGANGTQPTGVSDPTNGSYTSKQTATDGFDPATVTCYIFQNNTASTALTITVTWAAAQSNRGVWLKEIGGAATATPYQTGNATYSPTPGTGAGAISSGSMTPTSQPCLLSAVSVNSGVTAAYSAASPLVQGVQGWKFNGTGAAAGVSGSLRLTSTSAVAATFTDGTGGASGHYVTIGIIWTEAAASTVNVVQETSSTGGSGTAVALAFSSNVTAGSSGHCVGKAQTSTAFTVTDNKGNTWTQRGPVLSDGGGRSYAHFTCDNMAAGATTVTLNCSPSGASVGVWIREIGYTDGFDTHAEQVQLAYSSAATDGVSAGVQAPSVTPGLISGFSAIAINTPPVLAAGTGFTGDIVPWGSNSGLSEHKRYTGAIANLAATWTASTSAATVPVSFAAYFKEHGAATPTVLAGAATPTSGGTTTSLSTGSFNTRDTVANTAAFSGFVTSLNLYVNSIGTGVVLYLALYDTSNNLLCEGQINLSVGLNTIGIANGPFLTASQAYWIGAQSDGTVVPADDSGVSKKNLITNAVLPPPTGLIFPGSTVTGGRMTLWAAGIAGTVPTSPMYHRRTTLYFI